jgi:hypothetical protein
MNTICILITGRTMSSVKYIRFNIIIIIIIITIIIIIIMFSKVGEREGTART